MQSVFEPHKPRCDAHDDVRRYRYETHNHTVIVRALGPSVAACLAIDASSVEMEDEWSSRTAPDEIHLSFVYIRRPCGSQDVGASQQSEQDQALSHGR